MAAPEGEAGGLRRFRRDRRGEAPLEYVVLTAVVALAVLGSTAYVAPVMTEAGRRITAAFERGPADPVVTGTVTPAPAARRDQPTPRSIPQQRPERAAPLLRKLDWPPVAASDIDVDETPLRRGE